MWKGERQGGREVGRERERERERESMYRREERFVLGVFYGHSYSYILFCTGGAAA